MIKAQFEKAREKRVLAISQYMKRNDIFLRLTIFLT